MIVVRNVITEPEIQAVAAYVGSLGSMQVARTLAKRGRFLPAEISIRPGTGTQLIIQNSGVEAHVFKSDDMGIDELTVAGRSSGALAWKAPAVEGEFTLYCTDCALKDQYFTIRVDAAAAEFKATVPPGKSASNSSGGSM
jgi:hypothetical protein